MNFLWHSSSKNPNNSCEKNNASENMVSKSVLRNHENTLECEKWFDQPESYLITNTGLVDRRKATNFLAASSSGVDSLLLLLPKIKACKVRQLGLVTVKGPLWVRTCM